VETQLCKDLPFIVIVVQSVNDRNFIKELIKYSLLLYEAYQILPILLIFSVEEPSSGEIKSKFKAGKDVLIMEASCGF
jgi:hypothetical protein